ncbi:ribokinase [Staphylococcus pseudoxylosus]|uniref:ribokinase n=1 Tax=Staphylococcus pseudoxylosus TaxID=2282419 RepID=UPI00193ACF78|nr:ribokinase [Staphylococcus pseudoxylosus]MBM2658940.1 ribokinase [Staphylococcus pseudoxylosus]
MKILNFGSLNIDRVYKLPHLVENGETLSSSSFQKYAGGKGLNQSIALSRAGSNVYHAGKIGEDGDFLIQSLVSDNINVDAINKTKGITGHAIIQVDAKGNNSIFLYGGENQTITTSFIKEVFENFNSGYLLVLQNEISHLDYIIDLASKKQLMIALNPSPMNENIEGIDLNKVDFLFLNEIEGRILSGEKETHKILKKLISYYPDLKIIITLGVNGAVYKDKNQEYRQRAINTKVIDTTGAGDTFLGYFLSMFFQKKTVEESLLIASKASSLSISKKGGSSSIPKIDSILT